MNTVFLLSILFLIFLIWLTPFIMVAKSDEVGGNEKIAWLLAMFFISWFAWIFYWLLAPLSKGSQ
ncbi:MAG: hypothetical protein ACPGJI_01835 [Kangiellaceae bacterium]